MGPVPGKCPHSGGTLPPGSGLKLDLGAPPRMGVQPISVPGSGSGAPGSSKLSGFTPTWGNTYPTAPTAESGC